MQSKTAKIVRVLGSRRFFYGVIIFFVLEALWVAFSAAYPMAFDEDFHFGIIKIYSQHWLPFLAGQPNGANAYGAVATDPSYLYHYGMSFPYRLIAGLTNSLPAQVVFLRIINIAIFGAAIVLFWRLLRKVGTSESLTNTAVALFVLIPIVPLMAGQINYDSLLLLLLAWVCSLVLTVTEGFRKHSIAALPLGLLVIACIVASLVKYAFLPIALAAVVYTAIMLFVSFRGHGRQLLPAARKSFGNLGRWTKIALIFGLVVSGVLFVQRYGMNAVRYHDPLPDCGKVIGADACMEYGPWARNYKFAAQPLDFNRSPIAYSWGWLQAMHYRMFFMVSGPPQYVSYPPSPLPSAAAIMIGIFSIASLLFYWRRVFGGHPLLVFLLGMTLVYAGVLWAQNYSEYLQTTRPVAINGRYLVPFLLPLAAVFGRALSVALAHRAAVKVWAAAVAIILFVQGGGALGFVSRSDSTWYWKNQTVIHANQTAQNIVNALIFEGPKYY